MVTNRGSGSPLGLFAAALATEGAMARGQDSKDTQEHEETTLRHGMNGLCSDRGARKRLHFRAARIIVMR